MRAAATGSGNPARRAAGRQRHAESEALWPGVQAADRRRSDVARNLKIAVSATMSTDSADVRRRSVYMFHKRVVPYPLLQAFDRPDALQSCGRREHTTVAPQALALLNDASCATRRSEFADRLLREAGGRSAAVRSTRAFLLGFGPPPSETERAACWNSWTSQTNSAGTRCETIGRRALAGRRWPISAR